ncbi:MAG TPA: TonB-dependent receptor [Acidobacteriota bacterium]|nr:TonB-dependent receptor [Acidobacteriota bacterium]HNT16806.1 TonB-dependent receptor [Acidobacteriota bacterium]
MNWRVVTKLLTVLVAILAVTAVWAQSGNTGSISGKVLDPNGEPIPGATVVVSSNYLQGTRGTQASVDGEFMIPFLPPANDYKLTVEAPGFGKVVQSGVVVNLGSTTNTLVTLITAGEEMTVTGRPPVVTLKETKVSTNLTQEELESLPVDRSYQSTLYLAPNVVASGSGGNPSVSGGTAGENIYLMNGINTTDPATGTFGTNVNYNFIRETEVSTGSMDAEYGGSTGGLFNMLTKSGSNEYHGEVFFYYTDDSFNAKPHSTDFGVAGDAQYKSYDYGFDVGGPIMKDRLWFFVGYNPNFSSYHSEGSSTSSWGPQSYTKDYSYDDVWRSWMWSAKFTLRLSDRHNVEASISSDPSHIWYNEGSLFSPYDTARMTKRFQSGYNTSVQWYGTWTNNLFSEVGYGKNHSRLDIIPWFDWQYGIPSVQNYYLGLELNNTPGFYSFNDRDMSQIYAKVQYIAKKHEFKIGFDKENNLSSTKQGPTGGAYITLVRPNTSDPLTKDRNAYSYWYRLYPENPWSKERGGYFAFFAQDKWTLREGLLINLGMRFERNSMKPEGGQYFDLDSWSPRVSVSWDPWKNGRSKFYLSWGRYVERIPTGFINSMEPGRGYVYEYYRGDNPWFIDYSGSIPATVLPGTGNQYAEELAGGFDIEVTPDFAISVVAQYRELKQVIEDIGYMTSDGLINYFIGNPDGTYPDQCGPISNWSGSVVGTPVPWAKPVRRYKALTIKANKRFSNHWFLNANYVLSSLKGNFEGGGRGLSTAWGNSHASQYYDVPDGVLQQNSYGFLPTDRRHVMKIQGSYKFDWGLTLGTSFDLQTGRPIDKLKIYDADFNYNNYSGAPRFVIPRGAGGRLPATWSLDLHAEYSFKIWKTDWAVIADIFNVTNNQTATSVFDYVDYYGTTTWNGLPIWGQTTGRQGGRSAKVGFKMSF